MTTQAGRVAIITGGASGIGASLARELAALGADIVVADRQADLAASVAREICDRGGCATAEEVDVRDFASVERLVTATLRRTGRIDYLFNNAGIGIGGEVESFTIDDWKDVFDVNIDGVVNGIQAVYPVMIQQKSGHIINTASVAGLVSTVGEASYGASKHAVVALSKTLRIEAARHRVQVSVLCPGAIRTPILSGGRYGRMKLNLSEENLAGVWDLARPMDPEAFAKAAVAEVLRNKAIIVLPKWWKALWYLERLSPEASMKVWGVFLSLLRNRMQPTKPHP